MRKFTYLLKTLLISALFLGANSAWGETVDLTARTPNGELYYTSHSSGLTYGGSVTPHVGSTSEDGWYMNNNITSRSVECTLNSALAVGDIISVEFYAEGQSNTDIFNLYTKNDGSASEATIGVSSNPTKGQIYTTNDYAIPEGSGLIGSSKLFIGKGAQNHYVRKVIVRRTDADDLRPNTLSSNKTWTFTNFNSITTAADLVNNDLLYYSGTCLESSNYTGYTTALQLKKSSAVMFVVPAGTGKVEVQFLSGNGYERSLKYQIGSNSATTAGTTTSKEGVTMSFGYNVTKETQIKLLSNNDSRAYAYSVSVNVSGQETITLNATYPYASYSCVNDIDVDNISTTAGDVTVYKASESDGSKVTLEPVTGKVPAGTGLILKGTGGAAVTIPYTTGASALEGTNLLKALNQSGNLTAAEEPDGTATTGTNYVLTVQEGNVVFAPIDATSATMKAGQAYLNVPSVTPAAKSLRVVVDGDEATGVEAPAVAEVEEDEVLYNMAGIQVDKNFKGFVVNQKGVKRFNR